MYRIVIVTLPYTSDRMYTKKIMFLKPKFYTKFLYHTSHVYRSLLRISVHHFKYVDYFYFIVCLLPGKQ